ncbi:MAG: metallophosphatase family protein [Actinomycetota bacterium]|nr:metallophosphatase family protein [Actinomycetota bacterium]
MALLAILYDVHGNLPALEEVLREAEEAGAERYLLGGDYVAPEPLGSATLARLRELEHATWIRGNGERWLTEPPENVPEIAPTFKLIAQELANEVERLYELPTEAEVDGVLYVHGSPHSDVESFARDWGAEDEKMLDGVRGRTVVFGHSHLQFRRPGPNGTDLVNPGSVGMPLDGDVRAAWALRPDGGDFEFRRTDYDMARQAAAYRALPDEYADMREFMARRIERGSD